MQHDDHCWLCVGGSMWAIHRMRWPLIWLWRGNWPYLEFNLVEMSNFNSESYADKAIAMMKKRPPDGNASKRQGATKRARCAPSHNM